MPNVIAHGGSLFLKVFKLTLKWTGLAEVFERCMAPLRGIQFDSPGDAVESDVHLTKQCRLCMRIRGKDAVKTLMSELKLKSASVNTHRGTMAAAAKRASKKRKMAQSTTTAANQVAAENEDQIETGDSEDDDMDLFDFDIEDVMGEFAAGDGDVELDGEDPSFIF